MMIVILRCKGGRKILRMPKRGGHDASARLDNPHARRPANPVAPPRNRRYWNRHAFDFDQASLVVGLLTAAFRSACA
jgi:hypothetical protein